MPATVPRERTNKSIGGNENGIYERIFSTLDEAKTFRNEYGGEILEFASSCNKVTGMNDYKFEAIMCGMSNAEMIKQPYCVVWNWKYSSDFPAQNG